MKIEFLESGSADCPLLRIFGDEPDVCQHFRRAFEQLANGSVEEVSLTDLPGVEPLGGCSLIAKVGSRDRGVIPDEGTVFQWVLTAGGWDNVAGLLEPFCTPGNGGYQWLHQTGDIRVLISPTGDW
jgi:hypothetical protein